VVRDDKWDDSSIRAAVRGYPARMDGKKAKAQAAIATGLDLWMQNADGMQQPEEKAWKQMSTAKVVATGSSMVLAPAVPPPMVSGEVHGLKQSQRHIVPRHQETTSKAIAPQNQFTAPVCHGKQVHEKQRLPESLANRFRSEDMYEHGEGLNPLAVSVPYDRQVHNVRQGKKRPLESSHCATSENEISDIADDSIGNAGLVIAGNRREDKSIRGTEKNLHAIGAIAVGDLNPYPVPTYSMKNWEKHSAHVRSLFERYGPFFKWPKYIRENVDNLHSDRDRIGLPAPAGSLGSVSQAKHKKLMKGWRREREAREKLLDMARRQRKCKAVSKTNAGD
jgi:hypothetical protein